MLFDLGMNTRDLYNKKMVRKKIKEVEESFDLVMIAEQFDESIVLLKNELCWEVDDVRSFHLNGRKQQIKSKLDETTKSLLRDYLKSDYLLYNHFLKIFNTKVRAVGKYRMSIEVAALKEANRKVYDSCSVEATENGKLKGNQKWYGPGYLIGYQVNNMSNKDCLLMTMSGLK